MCDAWQAGVWLVLACLVCVRACCTTRGYYCTGTNRRHVLGATPAEHNPVTPPLAVQGAQPYTPPLALQAQNAVEARAPLDSSIRPHLHIRAPAAASTILGATHSSNSCSNSNRNSSNNNRSSSIDTNPPTVPTATESLTAVPRRCPHHAGAWTRIAVVTADAAHASANAAGSDAPAKATLPRRIARNKSLQFVPDDGDTPTDALALALVWDEDVDARSASNERMPLHPRVGAPLTSAVRSLHACFEAVEAVGVHANHECSCMHVRIAPAVCLSVAGGRTHRERDVTVMLQPHTASIQVCSLRDTRPGKGMRESCAAGEAGIVLPALVGVHHTALFAAAVQGRAAAPQISAGRRVADAANAAAADTAAADTAAATKDELGASSMLDADLDAVNRIALTPPASEAITGGSARLRRRMWGRATSPCAPPWTPDDALAQARLRRQLEAAATPTPLPPLPPSPVSSLHAL